MAIKIHQVNIICLMGAQVVQCTGLSAGEMQVEPQLESPHSSQLSIHMAHTHKMCQKLYEYSNGSPLFMLNDVDLQHLTYQGCDLINFLGPMTGDTFI